MIAMISRSLWVMRMTVLPCSFSAAKQLEQRVGLRRREHGGGLVEDEDIGAAIERFENFDALLQADGEIADGRIHVDLEAVIPRQPRKLRAHLRFADAQQGAAFGAEHHVLDDA